MFWKVIHTSLRSSGGCVVRCYTMTSSTSVGHAEKTLGCLLEKRNTILREAKAADFCQQYLLLDKPSKEELLKSMAVKYDFNGELVKSAAKSFFALQDADSSRSHQAAERLRSALSPCYVHIFQAISSLNVGVKFLVDMRADLLDLLKSNNSESENTLYLKSLNRHLKEFLSFSFNVGFLTLERITWNSSCHMLQKISDYEAVHPMRNWTDLKRRVGPYRRCFVFTHSSMPNEPVVVLHTALTENISSRIHSIVHSINPPESSGGSTDNEPNPSQTIENPSMIQAAVFYSISTTQRGLAGFDLGNQLIKKVAGEILKEFPHISKLSSLSPIPGFREWLLMEIKKARGSSVLETYFTNSCTNSLCRLLEVEAESIKLWDSLAYQIASNQWASYSDLKDILKQPLMGTCAHYLCQEKRRSYALNSVAHFHLQNGAVLWRLNWEADLSPRGLSNSCGIMVNYRYFLEHTERNSQKYIEDYYITSSEDVMNLITSVPNKSNL